MLPVPMSDERRIRSAAAALAFSLAAALAYVAQRLLDYARGDVADPLATLGEAHTAFYWRCAASAWWGGLAALATWVLLRRSRDPVRHTWMLAAWTVPLGLGYVLLAWAFP